ncbi:signal peptidase complex subunit 3-like [Antedon mediterranea]|uniref:signal peptidase complex subunit 3-like n=1 Tax=Antedon mediterranea TaxID=105859 RepID=UPI003AF96EA2
MNTVLSRLNTVFAFTLSVMAALTFGCFLTTAFNDNLSSVQIETFKHSVKSGYTPYNERSERGNFVFDLHADLNPIFNWNVKQLFLYLTAEYKTEQNALNQVVLWDKIILRGNAALLDYRGIKMKYPFFDDGNGLKGHDNVTLTLSWNVIPNAGMLPRIFGDGSTSFSLPVQYSNR